MTPEVQKQYEDLFSTFATDGWRAYIDYANSHLKSLQDTVLHECTTSEDLAKRKGSVDSLYWVVGFEESVRQAYEIALEDTEYERAQGS